MSEGVSLALGSSFLAGCDPSELRVLVPVLAQPPPARGAGRGSAAPGLHRGAFLPPSSGSRPNPSPRGAVRADGLAVACEPCALLFRCFSFAGAGTAPGRGGELWFQLWDLGGAGVKCLGKGESVGKGFFEWQYKTMLLEACFRQGSTFKSVTYENDLEASKAVAKRPHLVTCRSRLGRSTRAARAVGPCSRGAAGEPSNAAPDPAHTEPRRVPATTAVPPSLPLLGSRARNAFQHQHLCKL